MKRRRGDDIPSVSDYAHYNEEAEAIWYAENRYDMENWDEEIDDDDLDDLDDEEDEDESLVSCPDYGTPSLEDLE